MPVAPVIKKGYSAEPVRMSRVLMRGRPEDSSSHQTISCGSEADFRYFISRGWRRAAEFMDAVNDARRGPR